MTTLTTTSSLGLHEIERADPPAKRLKLSEQDEVRLLIVFFLVCYMMVSTESC